MVPDVSTTEYTIRAVRPHELPAVRRMLPSLFTAAIAPDRVIVCASAADERLIGAAAIAWNLWGTPPGFPLWVHVLEEFRRRGCGRELVAAAARAARSDTAQFHAWSALDEDNPACDFLRAVG